MANNPYTSQSVGATYNQNPPADDASAVASNQLNWSKHIDKIGDPLKTFAQAINTAVLSAFGKVINTDDDENNSMTGSLAFGPSDLTISGGSVTVTRSQHRIDTQSGAATDDLDTLSSASVSDGCLLVIRPVSDSRTVVVKNQTDNIYLKNGDFTMDTDSHRLVLQLAGGNWYELARTPNNAPLLHVQEQQTAGTAAGGFTSGAWQTRTLNTSVTNEITDASLGSNQITLPSGTYYIEASAPGMAVSGHQTKLYNITDSTDDLLGTSEVSNPTNPAQTRSFIRGRFTIAASKVYEIQHYCGSSKATNGFGNPANFGVTEVYADVRIWKIG